jgi:hypothetical protein
MFAGSFRTKISAGNRFSARKKGTKNGLLNLHLLQRPRASHVRLAEDHHDRGGLQLEVGELGSILRISFGRKLPTKLKRGYVLIIKNAPLYQFILKFCPKATKYKVMSVNF